mmetsp:Transcript_65991/g.174937  ORF Transcript_65991/g.174937 Transcript_65991/m.174937 type:complete len:88 (+) Transcript_65991:435-698(+)
MSLCLSDELVNARETLYVPRLMILAPVHKRRIPRSHRIQSLQLSSQLSPSTSVNLPRTRQQELAACLRANFVASGTRRLKKKEGNNY